MSRQLVVLSLFSCFLVFVTFSCVTAKVIPSSPWASLASKSVYSRSLGPPPMSGFGTINVPFMPKSPFFPKFVDPKTIIAKKTDMVGNLFGGVGTIPDGGSSKSIPSSFLQYPSMEEQSDSVGTKMDDISQLYAIPKFQSMLPSMGEKRSATLLADNPELSVKDTKPSDKDEIKDFKSSSSDSSSNPDENLIVDKEIGSNSIKEYLPGMMGPLPTNPSMFIDKKYSFLDTLFKNIAASTTPIPIITEAIPTSTIVPPEFWIPSSMIPGPLEYNEKVSAFLDKLFDTLKSNISSSTTPEESSPSSSISETRVARSVEDVSSIIAAKDAIVETILAQLGSLKENMISVLNDTIAYQKSTSMSSSMIPKKPFLPSMWMKPTVDPMLPFQQKMAFLSQMFDMLIELQKNISASIQEAVKSELSDQSDSQPSDSVDVPLTRTDGIFLNGSFIDAIAQSLAQSGIYPTVTAKGAVKKIARATPSATSFWVAYPEDAHTVAKRHAISNNLQYPIQGGNDLNYPQDESEINQSAGTLRKYDKEDNDFNYDTNGQKEKLGKLKKYINRMEYLMNESKEHKHHHHHY